MDDPGPRFAVGDAAVHRATGTRVIVLHVRRLIVLGSVSYLYATAPVLGRTMHPEEDLAPVSG